MTQAEKRIRRLRRAIGDTNAAYFDPTHHIRCILVTLEDKEAIRVLDTTTVKR